MKTSQILKTFLSLNLIIALLSIMWVLTAFTSCTRNKKSVSELIEMIPNPAPSPPLLVYLDSTYLIVDELAEFKEGDGGNSFRAYLSGNITYPEDAKKGNLQGKSLILFDVEKDGSVSNVKVSGSSYPSLDAEAVRVVKSLPKFEKPAKLNGELITTRYKVLISFALK